jgi:hypothetical protein
MFETLPWNRPDQPTAVSCAKLANAMAELKTRLQNQYERVLPGQPELVRDAIAVAEALAWLTPFPHLFLPDLAEARITSLASQSAFVGNDFIPSCSGGFPNLQPLSA